jgi:hypothetical protein
MGAHDRSRFAPNLHFAILNLQIAMLPFFSLPFWPARLSLSLTAST